MILLEITGLEAYYGESRILNNLSMAVPKGKIVCLIGRNGVGKSTVLRSVMGLVKTPSGSIKLRGRELIGAKTWQRAREGIGYVPQGRDIFPQLTVEENLRLGFQIRGGRSPNGMTKEEALEMVYDLFPVIADMLNRKGGDLSGGQQQQLAIARALVASPDLLILDEPTEGIQPSIIQDIVRAIRKINKGFGISLLVVEQYLDFVMNLSDQYYVMVKGVTVLNGETEQADPDIIQTYMTI
jgi:urea transport system ATP-binding protein